MNVGTVTGVIVLSGHLPKTSLSDGISSVSESSENSMRSRTGPIFVSFPDGVELFGIFWGA